MDGRRTLPSPILYSGTIQNATLDVPDSLRVTISVTTTDTATIYFGDATMGVHINESIGYNLANVIWQKVKTIRVEGSANIVVQEGRA